jgi:hypothetical protein
MSTPRPRRTAPIRRPCVAALVLATGVVATGCSPDASPDAVPVVTPTHAYAPFPYDNAAQRDTFAAFLSCAAAAGIDYEGPFMDSTGHGIFLRLAAGEHASRAQQDAVGARCPQMTVGMFGTPVDRVRTAAYERAARDFATCVRRHGVDGYPAASFAGGGAPAAAFWRLPFDWSSERFTSAARSCVDPLRDYLFSG